MKTAKNDYAEAIKIAKRAARCVKDKSLRDTAFQIVLNYILEKRK
jgi:hypothetical protein